MAKDYITMDVSIKEIKNLLIKNLSCKNGDQVAEVIVQSLIDTNIGLKLLYKALTGLFPETNVKVGEIYYVHIDYLPTWRLDKIKTLSLPGTKDDFYIPVRVEAINLYREPSIEVRFKMVNTTDQEVFDMYYVDDYRLAFKSEDPEQTLDEIEKIPDEV